MTVKGTLIATLAAGFLVSTAPLLAHADDKAAPKEGEKAACKGKGGCKGEKAEKPADGEKKEEKKAGKKKKDDKAAEAPPAEPAK